MTNILVKATSIWLLIALAAIFNGLFREKVLVSAIGSDMALPLSGMLLAILVFLVTLMSVSFIGSSAAKTYLWVGMYWLVLTLSFEFLFGHFIAGKPWEEILQVFNIRQGNLFSGVLLVTGISPWLAAKTRGIVSD